MVLIDTHIGTRVTDTRVPDTVALAALFIPYPLYSRLDIVRFLQTG